MPWPPEYMLPWYMRKQTFICHLAGSVAVLDDAYCGLKPAACRRFQPAVRFSTKPTCPCALDISATLPVRLSNGWAFIFTFDSIEDQALGEEEVGGSLHHIPVAT